MKFQIETLVNGKWTNNPSYLGNGTGEINIFDTKEDALRAIQSLVEIGFDNSRLKVSIIT